jgi:formylglycine-generating enzyme required for sulfatase activity
MVSRPHAHMSASGVVDLIGNVWEWYEERPYEQRRRETQASIMLDVDLSNPFGPPERLDAFGVIGGGYLDELSKVDLHLDGQRLVASGGKRTRHSDLGFRVAAQYWLHELPARVVERLSLCPEFDEDDLFRALPRRQSKGEFGW